METQVRITAYVSWLRNVKHESDYNSFDLFQSLLLGMSPLGYFKILGYYPAHSHCINNFLVHCILPKAFKHIVAATTSQTVSSRLDVKGVTDPTTCINI